MLPLYQVPHLYLLVLYHLHQYIDFVILLLRCFLEVFDHVCHVEDFVFDDSIVSQHFMLGSLLSYEHCFFRKLKPC